MSDDNNKKSEPFDFDFDALNADAPQTSSGESSFDLDSPFGDDVIVSGGTSESTTSTGESSFDLAAPFGDDLAMSEGGISADNPYLDNESATSDSLADSSEEDFDESGDPDSTDLEESDKKKKGKGGWFSKNKDKSAKGKKEKQPKPKKEKGSKEDIPTGEKVLRDWGTILCLAFSAFLLVSLLIFNVAGFFSRGESLMQTLCFLGAINIIGLAAAAVPLLFYKLPKERTLPNVMLGIAAVAMFCSLLVAANDFYRYGFVMTP